MPESRMNDATTDTPAEVQPLPTSQDVADTLARAFDATCDVLALLDTDRNGAAPGSLEHVALDAIMEAVQSPGGDFAVRLNRYLTHLPQPTDPRRHAEVPNYLPF